RERKRAVAWADCAHVGGRTEPAGNGDLATRARSQPRREVGHSGVGAQSHGRAASAESPLGGLTPLLLAAREGCAACAQALVKGKAGINLADPDNITPLLMAILNGRFDAAAALIEAGADPNRWDTWGRAPLYSAVDYNTTPRGGRPDRPSSDRTTALEVEERLLTAGANPNMQLKLFPPYRSL